MNCRRNCEGFCVWWFLWFFVLFVFLNKCSKIFRSLCTLLHVYSFNENDKLLSSFIYPTLHILMMFFIFHIWSTSLKYIQYSGKYAEMRGGGRNRRVQKKGKQQVCNRIFNGWCHCQSPEEKTIRLFKSRLEVI